MLLSVAVFLTLGRPDLPLRIASRILLVPVIAGVAYEFLKFSARHAQNPLWKGLMWPSLKLQRLTTREPDDSMLEVAIAAFLRILVADDRLPPDDPRLANARRVDADGQAAGARSRRRWRRCRRPRTEGSNRHGDDTADDRRRRWSRWPKRRSPVATI